MKRLTDPAPAAWRVSPVRRTVWGRAIALLLILAIGPIGCAKKEEPPATPSAAEQVMDESTKPMNMNWDQTNNCVSFVPENRDIELGDRVNFGTSMDTVRVHVPAGLFSVADTTFIVVRGVNSTSPTALAIGSYRLSSTPTACASTQTGGGPSIIVGTGTGNP